MMTTDFYADTLFLVLANLYPRAHQRIWLKGYMVFFRPWDLKDQLFNNDMINIVYNYITLQVTSISTYFLGLTSDWK